MGLQIFKKFQSNFKSWCQTGDKASFILRTH